MSEVFVFLEFNDPEIYALLSELRRVLSGGKEPSSQLHLTIRGPFKYLRSENALEKLNKKLNSEPILISGVGKFSFSDKVIVYLKVNSPHLEKIWYKPDFPINKYGFNPHITVFKGTQSNAEVIYQFLIEEDLSLLSSEYKITQCKSNNISLFPREIRTFTEKDFMKLIIHGRVKSGIIRRATNLIKEVMIR